MDPHGVLKEYFGHNEFRDGQEPLIQRLIAGGDVLGIMPTGGGKSLCYQVPALLMPGITLVVSPLISLMKDQVSALKSVGVAAAYINSSLTPGQLRTVYSRMREKQYKIIYVAPERLESEGFVTAAQALQVSLVAVDEAHCISQWGQDFRPSYLKIAEFLEKLPVRPVVGAFTATATERVRGDIVRILGLREPLCMVTGFDRPNLYFDVRRPGNKAAELNKILHAHEGKSGIVYCATRSAVERICDGLQRLGIAATRYHAGLSDEERQQNQDDFQFDRKTVMVATNAFGMGIDKSNVSFVVHFNMPKSLEAYYQEAGRAGRDGEPADCILLFAAGDINTAKFLIQNSENEELSPEEQAEVFRQDMLRLDAMVGYCKTDRCLRGYILDYFGQTHGELCGNCSNCSDDTVLVDITTQAQMILACVRRIRTQLGYGVGIALLVGTLAGSREKRVQELHLDELSTYGLLAKTPRKTIRAYIDTLDSRGYLRTDPEHGALELTAKADAVLFKGEKVEMAVRAADAVTAADGVQEEDLLAVLKTVRMRLAQAEGVPAYIIFSNATLADMARRCPKKRSELLDVSGIGEKKAARYGKDFLEAIRAFADKKA